MPIPTELFETITRRLAHGGAGATSAEALRIWRTLFKKFAPLLGPLSTELLFARSLAAQEAAFPWLPQVASNEARLPFEAFERCLEDRTPEDIAAVNRALLSSYTTLLSELIGMRLTVSFLKAAFPDVALNKNI
ncbi:hypothetical protein [Massilia sp. GCM10023247]|uniref:hypothetical protein n=1 Tax=Massilia sp. GCM10023247 TaxID=3252643 RepID=UPI0036102A5B